MQSARRPGGRSPSWLPESAPAVVLEELARHLQRWPAEPGDLLFRTSDGAPWPRNRLMEVFRRAVKAAGLPTGTTSHDLRHHYASLLIAAGCSVKSVQERLGHTSAVETLQTYAHLWPDDEDRTPRRSSGVGRPGG